MRSRTTPTKRILLARRRPLLLAPLALVVGLMMAACSSTPPRPRTTSKPTAIIPAPAGTLAITPPQADGSLWALAGTNSAKTITHMEATSGHVLTIVGVNAYANDIVDSSSGVLAISVGVGSVGAVDLRQASNGASITTIPTSEPVIKISAASGGNTFFALQAGADGTSVAVISAQSHKVVSTVPVPATATQVIGVGSGEAFWILLPGGKLEEFNGSPKPVTEFSTGQGGSGLAVSPNGQTMAILRSGTVSDIALVSLETQAVVTVVPAPGDAVDVVVSLDGHTLYVAASPPGTSNVQAIPFPST
ncbi:MAG TPA: hypothetical protein VGG38_05490 [Acidimicrobiales bacterium]